MPGQLLGQGTDTESLLLRLISRETAILADTLHLETLSMNEPDGTMLDLHKIFEAATKRKLDFQIWAATKIVFDRWKQENPSKRTRARRELVATAIEQFFFELGMEMRDRVPGPHVTLIDPRNHSDTDALVANAQRTYALFREKGVKKEDILVSIPATNAGIIATKMLQKLEEKINVNLYLVTSLMDAEACVEANATYITVPVGPLLRMYKDKRLTSKVTISGYHSGIIEIQSIIAYLKSKEEIRTKAIGTSFRNVTELGLLSDFNIVCVSPEQVLRLKGGVRVPITSLKGPVHSGTSRAENTKDPTNTLTEQGGSSHTWFSRDQRLLTVALRFEALHEMQYLMEVIKHYVELQLMQHFALDAVDLSTVYDLQESADRKLKKTENNNMLVTSVDSSPNEVNGADLEETSGKSRRSKPKQNVDEIF